MKKKIIPSELQTADLHQIILGSIAPRPIALVSTVDTNGRQNLAPFSFFNAFSSNPPIVVFSSNRRVEGNTTKDTLRNVIETKECVINMVNHDIVRQMMLCSVDFPSDTSEFIASGLTAVSSSIVKSPMVKESPVSMECKVQDIITLGDQGGAGHLIICHVECIHIDEAIMDASGRIDPHKIDLMGRMGRAFYVRASGDAVQHMHQTQTLPIITYPNLPEHVKRSDILTANDIATIAGMRTWPSKIEAIEYVNLLEQYTELEISERTIGRLHQMAHDYIKHNEFDRAIHVLASI